MVDHDELIFYGQVYKMRSLNCYYLLPFPAFTAEKLHMLPAPAQL